MKISKMLIFDVRSWLVLHYLRQRLLNQFLKGVV